jgi:uncharacterized protein DUF1559
MVGFARKLLVGVLVLALIVAYTASTARAQGLSASDRLDLSYVTPDAVAAIVAFPSRVLKAPEMEMLPHEVLTAFGKRDLGLEPADIDQIMVVAEVANGGPPLVAGVVRFAKPYQLDGLLPELASDLAPGDLDGKPMLQAASPMEPSMFMPDNRTLLIGMAPMIEKMVENAKEPAAGPLSELLASTSVTGDVTAIAVLEPVREMLGAMLMMAPVPPPLADVKQLPQLIKAAKIELQVTGMPNASVVLLAPDTDKADQLENVLNKAIDFGQQMAMQQMSQEMGDPDDPVEQAMAQYMVRMNQHMFKMIRPQRNGTVLSIEQGGQESMYVASTGVLVALLLPAIQAAREAARRSMSMNNMKQIALAMLTHHDTFKEFPAQAITDDAGKPLLSWRVKLLPFVEESALYKQFHLDEPWDSPHNKQLIERMPQIYARPNGDAGSGMTNYLAPVGEGTMWKAGKGTRLAGIRDGSSNTIMAVEVDDEAAVPWTKPADWEFDANDPMQGVGNTRPGGFLAGLADGSVHLIENGIDPDVLKALITMAGGEQVPRL